MTFSSTAKPGPVRDWLDFHDDRWTFMLLYIGGSVLLSIFASLFWVAMMVVAHFLLELFRHRAMKPGAALLHALWHLKLDVALIVFALVLALYGDTIFAALGLGQAARAGQAVRGMQIATRFAILERGIRVFLLTVDDLARVVRVVVKMITGRKSAAAATQGRFTTAMPGEERAADRAAGHDGAAHPGGGSGIFSGAEHCRGGAEEAAPWRKPGGGDIFALCFGALCLALVIGAPLLRGQPAAEIRAVVAGQLSP